MSAYSAIILLKVVTQLLVSYILLTLDTQLLRNPKTSSQLIGTTAQDIHQLIIKTADAYQDAAQLSPESTSCAYHARFLRNLVSNDSSKPRRSEDDHRENGVHLDPRLPGTLRTFSITAFFRLRLSTEVRQVHRYRSRHLSMLSRYLPFTSNLSTSRLRHTWLSLNLPPCAKRNMWPSPRRLGMHSIQGCLPVSFPLIRRAQGIIIYNLRPRSTHRSLMPTTGKTCF